MVELVIENLRTAVLESIEQINVAIGTVEELLNRLQVQQQETVALLRGMGADEANAEIAVSLERKINALITIRTEFSEERDRRVRLLEEVMAPAGKGGDGFARHAARCAEAEEMTHRHIHKLMAALYFAFDDPLEDSVRMRDCVESYNASANLFARQCQGATGQFERLHWNFQMREAMLQRETDIRYSLGSPEQEAARREQEAAMREREAKLFREQTQSVAPPPSPPGAPATFAPPAAPPSPPRAPAQAPFAPPAQAPTPQPCVPTPASGKEKPSILDWLKRKKKGNDTETGSPVPPPQVDSVQFSAVAPQEVNPGKYVPIHVVMYEDGFRKAVDDIVAAHGGDAKESRSGYRDVERNSRVKVILSSPDVAVEEDMQEQIWNGKYLNFEFAAKVPGDFSQEQILFAASVYVNDVITTKLKLILDCQGKPKRNITVTRSDILSAFVSYASQDRNRVAAIVQGMKRARPDMDIFFDIESLRSGQNWEDALKTEIANRDVLFLCWSRSARASKWVDMEWRYAYACKGEAGIEPIPIDTPDICPPPVELQEKHFGDKMLYIIQATMPAAPANPCLLRVKTGERLPISKPLVRIGKERSYVDIFIGDNSAISRAHANILTRDNRYYIVDTNSTNHVYVNGEMIPSNVEFPISLGDKIRLGNEEFELV